MSSNVNSSIAIEASALSKTYHLYRRPADRLCQWLGLSGKETPLYTPCPALKPVSFTIQKGETVGIVGRNGSGKSTLLQIICGTVTPTSGNCTVHGRISALLELGAGFNPEFTGEENIYLNGAILGLSKEEIRGKYESIVDFSGIGIAAIQQPVKTYSSGMYIRLAFAIAVASDPDILIVDEALAVGDEMFQRKCFGRIRQIQERGGTILFVSHAAPTIMEICNRALLLDQGELLLSGTPKQVIAQYHRLIFSPAEQLSHVREEIRRLSPGELAEAAAAEAPCENSEEEMELTDFIAEETAVAHAWFDPSLKPEQLITYPSQGAELSEPIITTLTGEPVNILVPHQRYRFSYRARFTEVATAVRCGMTIKSCSGFPLAGSTSAKPGEEIPYMEQSAIRAVSFEFTCLLLPGTYFINAGCTGYRNGREERIYLHRIVDACMFKVLAGEAGSRKVGVIDLLVEPHII